MKTLLRPQPAAVDPRDAARAELDTVEAAQAELPAMRQAWEAKRAAMVEAQQRAAAELAEMHQHYSERADALARRRIRAEAELRESCPPLVAERGPVVTWLRSTIEHVRDHLGGVGLKDDIDLVNAAKRGGLDPKMDDLVRSAKSRVQLAQHASEISSTLHDVLQEVRDLQLSTRLDLADALREAFGPLPSRCACGRAFDFTSALADQ